MIVVGGESGNGLLDDVQVGKLFLFASNLHSSWHRIKIDLGCLKPNNEHQSNYLI
jgi:hypothetical protein